MAKRAYKPISAGSSSKGKGPGGIEGDLFIIPVVAGVISVIFLMILLASPRVAAWPMLAKYGVASIPFFATTAYVFFFFVKRPPNFHRDFWDQLFYGADFNYMNRLGKSRVHPREKARLKSINPDDQGANL